jgi:hypothetical protein
MLCQKMTIYKYKLTCPWIFAGNKRHKFKEFYSFFYWHFILNCSRFCQNEMSFLINLFSLKFSIISLVHYPPHLLALTNIIRLHF